MPPQGWIVVERRPDGRLVRRSSEVTGAVADKIANDLRSQGREALAMRLRTPEFAKRR